MIIAIFRGSAHRDCYINVTLNHKILVVFRNLKNYDSHLIIQELDKFNLKINVTPYGFEKYMSFTINNKLSFIDSFQFQSSSFNSLVKTLKMIYLSREFDSNVLAPVKPKGFYYYKYMSILKSLKKNYLAEKHFIVLWTVKKYWQRVWICSYGCNKFEMKTMKYYHHFYSQCDVLLLSVLEKFKNNSFKNYEFCPSHYLSALALS